MFSCANSCIITFAYLSVRPSIRLFVCLPVCQSVRSSICQSIHLSIRWSISLLVGQSVDLSECLSVHLSVCVNLDVCLAIHLLIHLEVHQSVFPSVYLSIHPSVCVSICLSLSQPFYTPDESQSYYGMACFVRPSVCLSVRPSVNIWLSTGVTICRINFNFTDIMHLIYEMLAACMFSGDKIKVQGHKGRLDFLVSTPWLHSYLMDLLYIWHKYNSWGDNDSYTISMWIGQGDIGHSKFLSCPLRGFMSICWGVPQLLDPYIKLVTVLFY